RLRRKGLGDRRYVGDVAGGKGPERERDAESECRPADAGQGRWPAGGARPGSGRRRGYGRPCKLPRVKRTRAHGEIVSWRLKAPHSIPQASRPLTCARASRTKRSSARSSATNDGSSDSRKLASPSRTVSRSERTSSSV